MHLANAIAALRLSPADEADLRWFFTESDGALGLKSTFPGMVQQLQLGGGRRGTHTPVLRELDGRLVAAATRARLISRALEAVGAVHARVLRIAYGAPTYVELFPTFGELAGLAVETAAAVRLHRRARTTRSVEAWLARQALRARKSDAGAVQAVYEIRREAEGLLVTASQAYSRRRADVLRRSRSG